MSFSVLWTRLYEMGNFKIPVKSRYVYYAIGVSIPSFIHAFFVASKVNDSIKHFDKKYTPKYYEQYIEAISKKQTNWLFYKNVLSITAEKNISYYQSFLLIYC